MLSNIFHETLKVTTSLLSERELGTRQREQRLKIKQIKDTRHRFKVGFAHMHSLKIDELFRVRKATHYSS